MKFSVYILKEKEHDLFKRDNDNLIYNAKIPLGKALVGCFVELPTLDGRILSVAINDIGEFIYKLHVPLELFIVFWLWLIKRKLRRIRMKHIQM